MKSKKKCDINPFKPVFFAWFSFRVSCVVDGKRIQFGIGILTKQICYYPLLLVNRYFLTNDYYSPISIVGASGLGFDFWVGPSGHSVATAAMFLRIRSCVAQSP